MGCAQLVAPLPDPDAQARVVADWTGLINCAVSLDAELTPSIRPSQRKDPPDIVIHVFSERSSQLIAAKLSLCPPRVYLRVVLKEYVT